MAKKKEKKISATKRAKKAGISKKTSPSKKKSLTKAKKRAGNTFPIIGMGASAGGLDSFEKFFTHMPSDSEMAFILVQHLHPDYKSILPDLLKGFTSMEVHEAKDGTTVQPNCIYITKPGKNMGLLNGKLHFTEQTKSTGMNLPIDSFFRSLAQDQRENGICIILSGTGTDGSQGLKAIKEEGGLVLVQDPESAQYDGMPRSAVATGMVDYILSPDKMPEQLLAFIHYVKTQKPKESSGLLKKDLNNLEKICLLIRSQTGHDFSYYKRATIIRRIERRMGINLIDQMTVYINYLQENPDELQALLEDFLIGVSNFFRDQEAFDILKDKVIPLLFKNRSQDKPIRIWVPACSTGEEAYSIGILLQEHMELLKKNYQVQIFATDIVKKALDVARAGIYSKGIISDISKQYLERFFTKGEETFQINKNIREMMIFSEQSIIKDPPFSNIDLISCRNLLIYMEPELQKKVFSFILYSLNKNGYLFLGTSEYLSDFAELFVPIDKKNRLFRCKGGEKERLQMRILETQYLRPRNIIQKEESRSGGTDRSILLGKMAEEALLKNYNASCAIINEQYEILYTYGRTGKYLEPTIGEANWTILEMARKGLGRELSSAINVVKTQKKEVRCENVQVRTNGEIQPVNLTLKPDLDPSSLQPVILVMFEDISPVETEKAVGSSKSSANEIVLKLEHELRNTKEQLQSSNEELETTNEELQSTNEELQSSNEEMQSSNEELRTSQEELQSLNEELLTTNAELNMKMDELAIISNDTKNLMDNISVGVIFVDLEMCVQFFTPAATQIMSLLETDFGRPLTHVVSNIDYDIIPDIEMVLKTLVPITKEVTTQNRRSYMLNFRPYRTINYEINGVVITASDVTLERLAAVVKDSNDAITVQDFEGNITAWNKGAEKMYGYSEDEALTMNIRDIVPEGDKTEALDMVKKLRGEEVESFESQRKTKDGRIIDVWLTVTRLVDDEGKPTAVATTERNLAWLSD